MTWLVSIVIAYCLIAGGSKVITEASKCNERVTDIVIALLFLAGLALAIHSFVWG